MSLVISTGTNLGDRKRNLLLGCHALSQEFQLKETSRIYSSPAVDYLNQPEFLNQILVFEVPKSTPRETIEKVLLIETSLGRVRDIEKGPRVIDIDILFWDLKQINEPTLQVPHPRLFERSFIVMPLKEMEIFKHLKKHFFFPSHFSNSATPLDEN
jgi:2-amino-4-hydroxy-6-hydroxymethyldihydropteridine diphosphokinase